MKEIKITLKDTQHIIDSYQTYKENMGVDIFLADAAAEFEIGFKNDFLVKIVFIRDDNHILQSCLVRIIGDGKEMQRKEFGVEVVDNKILLKDKE